MLRKSLLVVSILGAAILIGCGTTETSNSNTAAGNSNKAATTSSSNTGSSSTTAPASGDKIGIPECDDYIAKYETCVRGKVPEAARASLESSLKTARDNWKKAAENAQSRGTLAAACKQASDAAAASMKAYGCAF
jgi:hypothetical protein